MRALRAFFALLVVCGALAAPPASARIIDGVVAVVDDEPVTFSEIRDSVAEALGIPTGDADLYLREESDSGRILRWIEGLVDSVLVRRELTRTGQPVTDQEIARATESIRKSNNLSEAEFAEALLREGTTPDGYRRRLRWQMERGAIVRAKKLKDVTLTDEEVRTYFRENSERFLEGGEVLLTTLHIPTPPEEAGSERIVRLRIAAQQAAAAVRSGRSLAEAGELIRNSAPGASVVAPDYVRTDDLQPEIQKEIRRLLSGETSPPFFTDSGAYLVTVLSRRGGTLPEFARLKDTLTEELADRRSEKALADILTELKSAASIDIRL